MESRSSQDLASSRFSSDYLTTVQDDDGNTTWVLVSYEGGHPRLTFYHHHSNDPVQKFDPKKMDYRLMYQGDVLDD